MADVIYRVVVDLSTRGDLGAVADRSVSKLDRLDSLVTTLGRDSVSMAGSLASAFERAVESAVSLAAHVASLGAGAAFAGITYGVLKLNRELETTQIGLAAIFGAQGVTSNMTDGMSLAGSIMDKMRSDAASLPGTFNQLVSIFKTISVPGFQAGATVDQVRKLASVAMATSVSIGLPSEQAARELAMLLEGRAGAHNVFGMRLAGLAGENAQHFNKLSAPERLAYVTRELAKFSDAIAVYEHSFEGLSTTLRDNGMKFARTATMPLFEQVKVAMGDANDWFASHQALVGYWAETIGRDLARAWSVGRHKIAEWWPLVESFAQRAEQKLKGIWQHLRPELATAERVGKHLLADPATLDRLEGVLKLYAGVKLGHTAVGALTPSPAMAMMLLSRGGGLLGGALGGGGQAAGVAAGLANPAGLAAAAAAVAALVAMVVAVEGAVHSLTDSTSAWHTEALALWKSIQADGGAAIEHIHHALEAAEPYAHLLADTIGTQLLGELAFAARAVEILSQAVELFASVAETAAEKLGIAKAKHLNKFDIDADRLRSILMPKKTESLSADGRARVTPGAGGGGGGVHVDKVEITVSSNADPNRIARVVEGHLANLARFRKSSPFVPNFSAAR